MIADVFADRQLAELPAQTSGTRLTTRHARRGAERYDGTSARGCHADCTRARAARCVQLYHMLCALCRAPPSPARHAQHDGAAPRGVPRLAAHPAPAAGGGRDANALRPLGATPLSAAALHCHAGCVAMLLGAGARDARPDGASAGGGVVALRTGLRGACGSGSACGRGMRSCARGDGAHTVIFTAPRCDPSRVKTRPGVNREPAAEAGGGCLGLAPLPPRHSRLPSQRKARHRTSWRPAGTRLHANRQQIVPRKWRSRDLRCLQRAGQAPSPPAAPSAACSSHRRGHVERRIAGMANRLSALARNTRRYQSRPPTRRAQEAFPT